MTMPSDTSLLDFVYTLGKEKVTLQEAAMIFYMIQKEKNHNAELTFAIDDFMDHFNNTASRSSWLFSIDMMTLSEVVSKSKDGTVTLTEYGEDWVNNNFNSIYALSTIYSGDAFNESEKC